MPAGCINDNSGGSVDSGCNNALPLCRADPGAYGVSCQSEWKGQGGIGLWHCVSFLSGEGGGGAPALSYKHQFSI